MLARLKWSFFFLLESILDYMYSPNLELKVSQKVADVSEEIGYYCFVDLELVSLLSFVLYGYFGPGYYVAGPHYTLIQEPFISFWGQSPLQTEVLKIRQNYIISYKQYKSWLRSYDTPHENCRCSVVGDVEGEDHPSQADYYVS